MKIRSISAGMALVAVFSVVILGRAARAALVQAAPVDATIQFGGELGFLYNPKQVTISPGESVTWQGDFTMHPLVSDEGLWQQVGSGDSFTHTFDQPGTFRFHCFNHGGAGGVGMSGVVVVQAAAGGFHVYLPLVVK